MEFLKEYLTEETFAKVQEELDGKDVKLANLKSGDYVSKDKYTALETSAENLKSQLLAKSTAYDELMTKVGDNDALNQTGRMHQNQVKHRLQCQDIRVFLLLKEAQDGK